MPERSRPDRAGRGAAPASSTTGPRCRAEAECRARMWIASLLALPWGQRPDWGGPRPMPAAEVMQCRSSIQLAPSRRSTTQGLVPRMSCQPSAGTGPSGGAAWPDVHEASGSRRHRPGLPSAPPCSSIRWCRTGDSIVPPGVLALDADARGRTGAPRARTRVRWSRTPRPLAASMDQRGHAQPARAGSLMAVAAGRTGARCAVLGDEEDAARCAAPSGCGAVRHRVDVEQRAMRACRPAMRRKTHGGDPAPRSGQSSPHRAG